MPLESQRAVSRSASGRQPFHSPITLTSRAFGAQTANEPPSALASSWHPSFSYRREWLPSRNR
ncbi:hypothetical protein D3C83_114510 [compost metagenome]